MIMKYMTTEQVKPLVTANVASLLDPNGRHLVADQPIGKKEVDEAGTRIILGLYKVLLEVKDSDDPMEAAVEMTANTHRTLPTHQPEDKLIARLRAILEKRFGTDFQHTLRLEMSSVDLYWILSLAEEGMHARIGNWRKSKQWGASEMMSAAEFRRQLEDFVEAIGKAPAVKKPYRKSSRK
jgi:hypothetical protein